MNFTIATHTHTQQKGQRTVHDQKIPCVLRWWGERRRRRSHRTPNGPATHIDLRKQQQNIYSFTHDRAKIINLRKIAKQTFIQQPFDVREYIWKGGQLFAILQQLRQIVGYALRRLLIVIVTITHLEQVTTENVRERNFAAFSKHFSTKKFARSGSPSAPLSDSLALFCFTRVDQKQATSHCAAAAAAADLLLSLSVSFWITHARVSCVSLG